MPGTPATLPRWGAIQPEKSAGNRLKLDLGLRRAVRDFNNMTCPGLGSTSFVRQVVWSVIALALAERAELNAMRLAEHIEALACFVALRRSGKDYDDSRRVQGRRKLPATDFSYATLSLRTNYVTVPFRVGTAATLVGLGLATGPARRFNALVLTKEGQTLARLALLHRADKGSNVEDWLLARWLPGIAEQIPQPVKDVLVPGVEYIARPGPASLENKIVRTQLWGDPTRTVVLDALRRKGDGLGSARGNQAFLNAVGNEGQKRKLRAAFQFEHMRHQALLCTHEIAQALVDGEKTVTELCGHAAIEAALDQLQMACLALRDDMLAADQAQPDTVEFCREQESRTTEKRLSALVQRLPGVLVREGDLVARGYLLDGHNEFGLQEDDAPDEAGDADQTEVPTPRRLLTAYRLMRDCAEERGTAHG